MKLLEAYDLKNLKLKNRIVLPPMDLYCSDENGYVNKKHKYHYVSRAIGGVGLIIVEATGILPNGRITDNCLGIWNDDQIAGLKEIVDDCHELSDAKVAIQINHAGRKCTATSHGVDHTLAPSPITFDETYRTPKEITKEEINEVIRAFGAAAKRAYDAGFDALEVHGAHGYLISEFLSPVTNKRTDEYGGSTQNRARLLKEVLEEVKKMWGNDRPISLRVSASDYLEDGMTPDEMVKIINMIKEYVDIVHVSSGGVALAPIKAFPGYQVPFASKIKEECNIPTIAVGLITDPLLVEEILNNKRADLVALGRESFRNPYWVNNVAFKKQTPDYVYPEIYEEAYRYRK